MCKNSNTTLVLPVGKAGSSYVQSLQKVHEKFALWKTMNTLKNICININLSWNSIYPWLFETSLYQKSIDHCYGVLRKILLLSLPCSSAIHYLHRRWLGNQVYSHLCTNKPSFLYHHFCASRFFLSVVEFYWCAALSC